MADTAETRSGALKALAILAIIGAINWGLVGLFNFNLVDAIFGGGAREETSGISRIIYSLVGLAGLGLLFLFPWGRRATSTPMGGGRRVEVGP